MPEHQSAFQSPVSDLGCFTQIDLDRQKTIEPDYGARRSKARTFQIPLVLCAFCPSAGSGPERIETVPFRGHSPSHPLCLDRLDRLDHSDHSANIQRSRRGIRIVIRVL
jgi:hypothetical protein